jgi:hypothetical protein
MGSPKIEHGMDFIDREGFYIENKVLSDRECDDLINAVPQSLLRRRRAGARHLMLIPTINAAAKDERLLRIARLAVGYSAIPFRATLFDKSARGELAGRLASGYGVAAGIAERFYRIWAVVGEGRNPLCASAGMGVVTRYRSAYFPGRLDERERSAADHSRLASRRRARR